MNGCVVDKDNITPILELSTILGVDDVFFWSKLYIVIEILHIEMNLKCEIEMKPKIFGYL